MLEQPPTFSAVRLKFLGHQQLVVFVPTELRRGIPPLSSRTNVGKLCSPAVAMVNGNKSSTNVGKSGRLHALRGTASDRLSKRAFGKSQWGCGRCSERDAVDAAIRVQPVRAVWQHYRHLQYQQRPPSQSVDRSSLEFNNPKVTRHSSEYPTFG